MSIARPPPTDETRLLGNEMHMVAIAHPARLREGQIAVVDFIRPIWFLFILSLWLGRRLLQCRANISARGSVRLVGGKTEELGAEAFVDVFGIGGGELGRFSG